MRLSAFWSSAFTRFKKEWKWGNSKTNWYAWAQANTSMNCFRFTIYFTYLFICLTLSFIINVSINLNYSLYVNKWCADRFIVCGQNYQNVRKAMLKSIFGNDQKSLKNALEVSFIFIYFHFLIILVLNLLYQK